MTDTTNQQTTHFRWQFGTAEFNESTRQLSIDSVSSPLEPKVAQLLEVLLRNAGEVLTQPQLLEAVWGTQFKSPQLLHVTISKLRIALKPIAEVEIETLPRVGYKLIGQFLCSKISKENAPRLALAVGSAVPLRPDFVLTEALASTAGREIWLARRESGEQRVYKFANTPEQLAALRTETTLFTALSAGLGERPDFAQILSWNLTQTPHFIESEYVGPDLRQWSSEHLPAMPRGERLALWLHIANAVSAAHSVGVLHQNLQPEHILLRAQTPADGANGHWLVKLSNFGIGTQPDGTGPASIYLAPEIIAGTSASIQSDVYALGVLLLQCLTADFRKTLAPGWQRELEDELLSSYIAGAADADPAHRTSSVSALIQQLESLEIRRAELAAARVNASRQIANETRLLQVRARRPWMLAAFAALSLAFAFATWRYVEADSARIAAERYATSVETVQRFLAIDVIGQASPADPRFTRDATVLEMLNKAAANVDTRFADEPLTLAALHRMIGASNKTLGNVDASIVHLKKSVALFTQHLGPAHSITLQTRYVLAHAYAEATQFQPANVELLATDALAATELGKASPLALQSAMYWGFLKKNEFKPAEALLALERALALVEQGVPIETSHLMAIRLARTDSLLRLDQIDRALVLLLPMEKSPEADQLDIQDVNRQIARAYRSQKNYQAALPRALKALKITREVYGDMHWNTLTTLSSLSYLHSLLEDCPASVAAAEEAYEGMLKIRGPESQGTLVELGNRGERYLACGKPEQGLADSAAAIAGLVQHYGANNAPAQTFAYSRAEHWVKLKRYPEALLALESLHKNAQAAISAGGGISVTLASMDLLRAQAHFGNGDTQIAAQLFTAALPELEKEQDEDVKTRVSALRAELCKSSPELEICAKHPARQQ